MFHNFCAHTGWQLSCTSAQLQIFYNERENPIPIETDPELELQAIHASAKKGFIPQYIVLLAIALLNGAMWISNLLGDPIDLLSTPTKLFTGFAWLLFAILCIVELVCYFRWHSKAKVAAEHGEFLKVPSTSKFQKVVLLLVVGGAIFWGVNLLLKLLVSADSLYQNGNKEYLIPALPTYSLWQSCSVLQSRSY